MARAEQVNGQERAGVDGRLRSHPSLLYGLPGRDELGKSRRPAAACSSRSPGSSRSRATSRNSSCSRVPTPSATTFSPEAAREADDRLGDGRVLRVGLEVGDERDVDLQRVDREMLQVRQRRVAGAEVVDRDREALVAQLVEHLANRVEVVQQARLGDFELDPRRARIPRS